MKSFEIDKRLIVEAWEKVRANNGAPGVDGVGIGMFQEQLRNNLYRLWNRMSSGSISRAGAGRGDTEDIGKGRSRNPSTGDRVAQTVAAMLLERHVEPVFHRDSYGYRPGAVAHGRGGRAGNGAGGRTGSLILMSGPFSTPLPIP